MRKHNLFRNRRAEVPDFVSDVFSFFLYLMFFMMFFILFTLSFGGCNKIESQSQRILSEWGDRVGDEQFMLNYLRTGIEIDGRQLTYAELIAESCVNDNYETLKEKTQEFMRQGSGTIPKNELFLRCDPEKDTSILLYKTDVDMVKCKYMFFCPSNTGDKIVKIPLPAKDSTLSYARLEMERCRYMDTNFHYLSDAEEEKQSADLKGCLR